VGFVNELPEEETDVRTIGSTTRLKAALVAVGTVAILGAGVATGAYAFADSNTTQLAPAPATPGVAVTTQMTRRVSVHTTKRSAAVRRAPALARFEGKLSLDDGLFKLKVMRIVGAGSSQYSWQLYEHRAALDVGPNVRIADGRGRQISLAFIDDAIVRVYGRLLPTTAWRWTDDGLRPVIRVQRIVVLRLDPEFGD
jgi:hypothetical protein